MYIVRLLLNSTTVLKGLFREYHYSAAALGKQPPRRGKVSGKGIKNSNQ